MNSPHYYGNHIAHVSFCEIPGDSVLINNPHDIRNTWSTTQAIREISEITLILKLQRIRVFFMVNRFNRFNSSSLQTAGNQINPWMPRANKRLTNNPNKSPSTVIRCLLSVDRCPASPPRCPLTVTPSSAFSKNNAKV